MTYDPTSDDAPSGYRSVPPYVWDNIRRDFAEGFSGPDLAARYNVPLSTIRDHQRREGWRRGDLPQDGPAPWNDADEADLSVDPIDMADSAWRNAARCIARGDRNGARTWTRLAADLRQVAKDSIAELNRVLDDRLETVACVLDQDDPKMLELELREDPDEQRLRDDPKGLAVQLVDERQHLERAFGALRPRLTVEALLSSGSPSSYLFLRTDEAAAETDEAQAPSRAGPS